MRAGAVLALPSGARLARPATQGMDATEPKRSCRHSVSPKKALRRCLGFLVKDLFEAALKNMGRLITTKALRTLVAWIRRSSSSAGILKMSVPRYSAPGRS